MQKNRLHCASLTVLVLLMLIFSLRSADVFASSSPMSLFSLMADWSFDGDANGDQMGYAVATAGNVNGDDYEDVIVGAPTDRFEGEPAGAAYVFHGTNSGLRDTPDSTLDDDQQGSKFGASVGSAGDVDGDGFDDLIVGAPGYKTDVTYGAAFVYLGSESPGSEPMSDWTYIGQQKDAEFGFTVNTAGDVNGDGYDDVIVGSRQYSNTLSNEGAAFVFHGSVNGLSSTPDWAFVCVKVGAFCGASVDTAGDVNGDGYADVVIGAPNYGVDNGGAAFVFHGSNSGLSSQPDWSFVAGESEAGFGISVSTAGDVNGDGVSEVIVGAPDYGENKKGACFLFYGAQGMGLGARSPHILLGEVSAEQFGADVGTAGDFNHDGYADIVIGDPFYGREGVEGEQKDEGASWVFYGSSIGIVQSEYWPVEGDKAETKFGAAVNTAGDVNDDGISDLIVGAPIYKRDQKEPHGVAFAYWGSETPPIVIHGVFLPLVLSSPP